MESDAELLARVRIGDDRDAFAELVGRHQSAVRRFLRHLCRNNFAQADDLAQDTFVEAHRALEHFRGESSLSAWLLGIAHNQFRNSWRRQQTAKRASAEIAATIESAPHATRASDLRRDLSEALGQLSQDEQAAVHLCYQQGLSHSEIAEVLDWPIGTVKTHLGRGKEKLRHLLAAWNPQT